MDAFLLTDTDGPGPESPARNPSPTHHDWVPDHAVVEMVQKTKTHSSETNCCHFKSRFYETPSKTQIHR